MRTLSGCLIGCLVIVFLSGPLLVGAQPGKLDVRLSWQSTGASSAPIDAWMIENKTFTKYAAKAGYVIEESWKQFPAGPPINEAIAAGLLDIDVNTASIPIVAAILSGLPMIPVAVTQSPLHNAIMVPANSPIRQVGDLRGKTVGLPIGSSAHYLLGSVVYYHFGKSLEEVGIKLLNMPVSEAIKMHSGIDAAVVWPPYRYLGIYNGLAEVLVDGSGMTGKAHATPGVRLPEVRNSWAYPEGYLVDRAFTRVHAKFLREHPDLVRAYLLARSDTTEAYLKNPQPFIDNINRQWKMPEIVLKQMGQQYSEVNGIRRSPFLTEGDIAGLVQASDFLAFLKLRERSLSWEELKPLILQGADLQRQLWVERGSRPSVAEMEKGFTGRTEAYGEIFVKGGAPVWQWASIPDWGKRVYPGGGFGRK
jgi:ABC-type nitrate/sulfonate/bicarbonate transport system substrate-binding protein